MMHCKMVRATDPACVRFVKATNETRAELKRLHDRCNGDRSIYRETALANPDEFPFYSRLLKKVET